MPVQQEISTKAPTASAQQLEEAFARHQGELLGTLYYLVGNADDAQDALQEAFVKCWRNIDQVPEVRNLRAWIFRIALNTGRDMRQTAWRRKRQSLPEEENMVQSRAAGPVDIAESKERDRRLRSALHDLREEEKEVFLLRQNGDLTYEEIGEAMGIPTGTVKTRMRLAIRRLREVLGNE